MKPAELRHITIVGTSIGSRDLPTVGERWGLAWHHTKGFDRLFEMHDYRYHPHLKRIYPDYSNLYMLPRMAKKYGAKVYPLAKVRAFFGGKNYFTSSTSYMLAMAIYENADEITINGVDLVEDQEYAYQRPCMEFYVGYARAKGIKVNIPRQSALCRHSFVYGQERPKKYGTLNGEKGEVIEYIDNQIDLINAYPDKGARLYGSLDAFKATRDAINQGARGADMSRLGQIND